MALLAGLSGLTAVTVLSVGVPVTAAGLSFDNVSVDTLAGTVGQVVGLAAARNTLGVLGVDWQAPPDALTATYAVMLVSRDDTLPAVNLSAVTSTTAAKPSGHVDFVIPGAAHVYDLMVSLSADAGTSQVTSRFIIDAYNPPPPPAPPPSRVVVAYAFPPGRAFVSRNFGLVEVPDGS